MMKKYFVIAALAAVAAMSCNKIDEGAALASQADAVKTQAIFTIQGAQTRATGTIPTEAEYQSADEKKVNSLQVFVFKDGNLDGYGSASNASQVSVSCTAGSRKVYAVVNHASLASVTTEADLKAVVSSIAEDADNFEMIGSETVTVLPVSPSEGYSVSVNRIASKLVVRKISNKLTNEALAAKTFKVQRVYITNVAGTFNLGLDTYAAADGTWYNKGGYMSSANLGTFSQDLNVNATVAHNASYETAHYFYAYPNNYDQKNYDENGWAPKRTMMVIQIQIGDDLYDYPIEFPVLASNKMYVVNDIQISKLGNPDDGVEGGEDEENPITSSDATFKITVSDWTLELVGDGQGIINI